MSSKFLMAVLLFACCVSRLAAQDQPLVAPPRGNLQELDRTQPKDVQRKLTFPEILAARGVDASQLSHMFDDRPFSMDEREALERTLAALLNLPADQIASYALPAASLPDFMQQPDEHRGQLIRLSGRVVACRGIAVVPELRERMGFSVIFRSTVTVSINGQGFVCDVFSPLAPVSWLPQAEDAQPVLNESVQFDAVFLKRATTVGGVVNEVQETRPVLATRRFSWFPDSLLGNNGFDLASLEEVVIDGQLTAADAPAFHGLLATMRKLNRQQLQSAALDTLRDRNVPGASLSETSRRLMVGFMAEAKNWRGEIVQMRGVARRALKIHVDDPELIKAYGTREYFEVEVFVEGPFRLPGFDDAVARYPITFCTTELPEDFPEGERLSVPVQLTGVFLKNWRYRSAKFAAADAGMQRAPLIIGGSIARAPHEASKAAPWGSREYILAAGVFALILGVAFVCWRWGTRDRIAARRRAIVLHKDKTNHA